jgi:predicted O-methyltransferase YrrM
MLQKYWRRLKVFILSNLAALFYTNRMLIQNFTDDNLTNNSLIVDLMTTFQADTYGHRANLETADLGYGWFHYGLIRTAKPKNILCIGSRHGFIPAVLAQACKDNYLGQVDFIDAGYGPEDDNHWTGEGFWQTKKGRNIFKQFELGAYLNLFVTTTQKFFDKYPDSVYDYVYIDGDHSYQGVKYDFEQALASLRSGGFIVFHDISVKEDKPEGEYGVYKLWDQIKQKHSNKIEFVYKRSGLGVLQKFNKESLIK